MTENRMDHSSRMLPAKFLVQVWHYVPSGKNKSWKSINM